MKNKAWVISSIYLAILCLIGITAYYAATLNSADEDKEFSILLTERIDDAIENRLNVPLKVSMAMANDSFLIDALMQENATSEKEVESLMMEYLKGLKESAGYSTAFVISDKTKRYYTPDGIFKIVNTEGDAHDIWYSVFLQQDNEFALDVDVDEVNEKAWTVFLDVKIRDDAGRLLGVCGVGVVMQDIQDLFKEYENRYGVKINLVDENGLVQADVNNINIETVYHAKQILSQTGQCVYTPKGVGGYVITKYIEQLNWYLVIQKYGADTGRGASPTPIVLMITITVLLIVLGYFRIRDEKLDIRSVKYNHYDNKKDTLTGLYNRNYFKEVYGERGIFNTTRYKSIAVFDIDFFKEANDTMDGNKILLMVTECAKKTLGDNAEIFRWGGDEFAVLMEWSIEFATEICRQFVREVEKDGRVTISLGVTEVRLSDTIKKNYYRAAQACYIVKEMGGNGVKRS